MSITDIELTEGVKYYAIIGPRTSLLQAEAMALELAKKHKCEIMVIGDISEIPLNNRQEFEMRRTPIDLQLTRELSTRQFEQNSETGCKGHEAPYKYHR